jgi:hypothetical protein
LEEHLDKLAKCSSLIKRIKIREKEPEKRSGIEEKDDNSRS